MLAEFVFDAIEAELERRGIDPRGPARFGVSRQCRPPAASPDPIRSPITTNSVAAHSREPPMVRSGHSLEGIITA
jgi:hypothetical protein